MAIQAPIPTSSKQRLSRIEIAVPIATADPGAARTHHAVKAVVDVLVPIGGEGGCELSQ